MTALPPASESRRREIARHPSLNGIDYLEVVDGAGLPADVRQRYLLVFLFKPLARAEEALEAKDVDIAGGNRRVRVLELVRGVAPRVAEIGWPLDPDLADRLWTVKLDQPGDFSRYRIVFRNPETHRTPENFDPLLAELEFSFKVESAASLDEPASVGQDAAAQAPPANYLAKDYASFRRLMLDRLAVTLPEWQERNPADGMMAVVEALAYSADQLSYYQDAVATEAYLGTARRRISVRRHARLLDYSMHEGCNARVWVCVETGPQAEGTVLPAHSQVLTVGNPSAPSPAPPGSAAVTPAACRTLLHEGAEGFETRHDLTLHAAHNKIPLHTFGDPQAVLAPGATAASLVQDPDAPLKLQPGDLLLLEGDIPPDAGPGGAPVRQVVRLTGVGEALHDPLLDRWWVDVMWEAADALTQPVFLGGGAHARGNMALADHGLTLPIPKLRVPPDDGMALRIRLPVKNLVYCESLTRPLAAVPASQLLSQEPRAALPAITLSSQGRTWRPVRDLLGSGPYANEFCCELDEDGTVSLRFGDDILGQRPEPGTVFDVVCRVGAGGVGNIGAQALRYVVSDSTGILSVTNPLPAAGGQEPESMEAVRLLAPTAFRRQMRAVTDRDYGDLAERHPEVQRAVGRFGWVGNSTCVFVAVDRRGGKPVNPVFCREIAAFLEQFRMLGHELEIVPPRFIPLEIVLTVRVDPGHRREAVRAALERAFSSAALPDGTLAYFHPDRFTFGQSVYLSPLVAEVMKMPGVAAVDYDNTAAKPNRFRRWGHASGHELEDGVIPVGPLEIARVSNDPNAPENGTVHFILEGGR